MPQIDNTCNTLIPVTANELILDLLATHEAHELSVAALCRAAAVFGMTEQSVRVALTRLAREGKVTNSARGRYAWNPSGTSLFKDVESWLRKEQRVGSWDGGWVGVLDSGVPRRHRVALRRHQRALELRGFERFADGLSLRPDNLVGGIKSLRSDLDDLGLAPAAVVLGVHGLSPTEESRARQLWDLKSLDRDYKKMLEMLERSTTRLDTLSCENAAAESLLLGRTVIRRIVRDPLLPEALLPGDGRRRLIQCTRRYQEYALAFWRKVLQEG